MKSWQTTLGGALAALGKTLMGVGILPQLAGMPNQTLTRIALAGFIIEGAGQFFTALFAADSKAVNALSDKVDRNSAAIITGDTSILKKEAGGTSPVEVGRKP